MKHVQVIKIRFQRRMLLLSRLCILFVFSAEMFEAICINKYTSYLFWKNEHSFKNIYANNLKKLFQVRNIYALSCFLKLFKAKI